MAEPGFFQIINTTRAIKRLKPDPVPLELRARLAAGRDHSVRMTALPRQRNYAERRQGAFVGR